MGRNDNRDRRSIDEKREDAIAEAELYRYGLRNREDNWLTGYWYLWALGGLAALAFLGCVSFVLLVFARLFMAGR